MTDEILTIPMVAEWLHLSERTVYRRAAAGELPAFKVGGTWRFRRSDIESWIQQQVSAANQTTDPPKRRRRAR